MKKLLLFIICISVFISFADTQENNTFREIYLHFEGRIQDIVFGDYNGDGLTDILITSIDFSYETPARLLNIFFQKKEVGFQEKPDQILQISRNAAALIIGSFSNNKNTRQICFLASDGLYFYPIKNQELSKEPKKLLHTQTSFEMPPKDSIPLWMIAEDLDGNGLDDIIIPDLQGYKVYMQTECGKFGKISHLNLPPETFADTSLTTAVFANRCTLFPHFFITYINDDKRKDIVLVQNGILYCFIQKNDGTFTSDIDSPPNIKAQPPILNTDARKDVVSISTINFCDTNHDGIADLIVTNVKGQLGIWESIETKVSIFFGAGDGRFITPDAIVEIKGVSINPEFIDVNGDGIDDIVVSCLRTDLIDLAKSYLLGADITYYIYTYDRKVGNYVESGKTRGASFSQNMHISIKDVEKSGIGSIPLIYFRADHNGDGKIDMVSLDPNGVLDIKLGCPNRDEIIFTRDSYYKVKLKERPNSLMMLDVNNDSRSDIFLVYKDKLGILLSNK